MQERRINMKKDDKQQRIITTLNHDDNFGGRQGENS